MKHRYFHHKSRFYQGIFLFFVFITLNANAQEKDSLKLEPYKTNILPSPTLTYSGQTDFVIGIYALLQFKFDKHDYKSKSSYINFYLASSFKDQYFYQASIEFILQKKNGFLEAFGNIKYFQNPILA